MRNPVVSFIVAPWVLLGTFPALAQAIAPPDKASSVQAGSASPPMAERDSFIQKTRGDLALWRGRLDELGAGTKSTAAAAGSEADRDLHAAWADMQNAALRLQSVGADGWSGAKAAYETATDRLAGVWHRVHPEKT